jgi:hypothetical protein
MSRQPNKPKTGVCVYCGSYGSITDDHVPPKAIFAKPRPSNLITVPACPKCHKLTTKDDEYFRIRLGLNDQARGHPDVNANLSSIFKSLNRVEAGKMRRQFIADSYPVEIRTPSGLYAGKGSAFRVDMNRIVRVVKRTILGLYFHETGKRLPAGHDVGVMPWDMIKQQGREAEEEVKNWLYAPLMTVEPKIIGQNVFSYRHQILPECSGWMVGFYGTVFFFAITSKPPVQESAGPSG